MTEQRYGDEFSVGQVFHTQGLTLTEAHVVNWAGLTGDFYPLHMDEEYARATPFGGRLVHGPLIFGLAVGLVALAGFAGNSVIAWLGVDNMRMKAPVRIGDTIRVTVTVLSQRTTSNPQRGVQVWRYSVGNQKGETVLEFDYQLMFHLRG
jgi:acyl dehydratase